MSMACSMECSERDDKSALLKLSMLMALMSREVTVETTGFGFVREKLKEIGKWSDIHASSTLTF